MHSCKTKMSIRECVCAQTRTHTHTELCEQSTRVWRSEQVLASDAGKAAFISVMRQR